MGKKTKSSPASPAPAPQAAPAGDSGALSALKEEGNKAFARKDYERALESYDKALKLTADANESALLHSNKAACHMQAKKYKDAVNECSAALEAAPSFYKALFRRAKAYEQMGLYKAALGDAQKAGRLEGAGPEAKQLERSLREALAGKRPGGLGNGLARAGAKGAAPAAAGSGRQLVFPAKLSAGDDTRLLQLVPGVTYLELMEHVKQLFPSHAPFVLKFLDKEGDLVTVGSRQDLQKAMQEALEQAQRAASGRGAGQAALQPIRLHVVRVASEDDVPRVPEDELAYMQQLLARMQQQAAAAQAASSAEPEPAAEAAPIQVDEWIVQFVELLKEHCGIDPDKPLEMQEVGTEKLNAAFKAMMDDDPKAEGLLDQATDKFKDQVCYGYYNQATVASYRAEKAMWGAAKAGAPGKTVAAEVEKQLKAAEALHDAALAYRPSFLDGYLGKSSLAQLRAKLAADYLAEPVRPRDDLADAKERAAAEEAASKAATQKALARVTAAGAKAAEPLFEAAYKLVQAAIDHMTPEDAAKEIKPMKPTAEQQPGDPDSEVPVRATLLINLGNAAYEHSILRAAGGADWKSLVRTAVERFTEAGAHAVDIRNALKGHPFADQMPEIVGPEPEPEAPAETANGEAKEVAGKEAKGLPSLPKNPKKKAES